MGLFSDIKDWFDRQLKKFEDFVRITLAGAIEEVTVWIRLRKHDFKVWMAEFMSTSGGFWTVIGIMVATVIVGTLVTGTAAWAALVEAAKALKDKVKLAVGGILGRIGYSLVNSAHNLGMFLNDDYAAAWDVFYQALSSLSEELRLGVSTINLMLRNARGIAYAATTFAGLPVAEAIADVEGTISEWMDGLEDRFERYVRNPEAIFNDIDQEIVWPYYELMQGGQKDILVSIAGISETVSEKAGELLALQEAVEIFVTDLPDEIEESARKTWDRVSEKFTSFYEEWIAPIIKVNDAFRKEFYEHVQRQQIALANVASALWNPGDILANVFNLPEPLRTIQLERIKAVLNAAGYPQAHSAMIRARDEMANSLRMGELYVQRLEERSIPKLPDFTGSRDRENLGTFDTWYKGIE